MIQDVPKTYNEYLHSIRFMKILNHRRRATASEINEFKKIVAEIKKENPIYYEKN